MWKGQKLKVPEYVGCSVAVSPFEVLTIHGTLEKNFNTKIRVYMYNMMTGVVKHYKAKNHPYSVSSLMNTCAKKRLSILL